MLPFLSKVIEKLFIRHFLLSFTKPLFNSHQFAFIPHDYLGTTNALTVFHLHILNCINTPSSYIRVLAIDFLKAFDKVSHAQLLEIAHKNFHLPHFTLKWLQSFLDNRFQRVHLSENLTTNWKHCSSGVPQGSILGLILFAMLINSYNVISSRSKVIIYADDLSIIHHVPTSLSDDSQFEINNLVSWASDNKLFINPIKTFVMNINPKNHFIPPLFLCDKIIKTSTSLKLLGITFTNDLKFNNHFTAIIKKCSYGMAAVTKLYHSGIRGKTLWQIYLALVFSQIAYCWPVICDIPQHCFTKLCSMERRASNLSERSYNPKELSVRLQNICLKLMKKVRADKNDPIRECFIERPVQQNVLRNFIPFVPMNKSSKLIKSFAKFYNRF